MKNTLALLYSVFKLRIGMAIMLTALAGVAVTPGSGPGAWQVVILALAVLMSSASAGAFNQYVERDLDAHMQRTRNRPFVTGRFTAGGYWLAGIGLLLAVAIAGATLAANAVAAFYVFLGAFVYGVVYTVWLKRRTWLNIVFGGLAGSFAVLAGAAQHRELVARPAVVHTDVGILHVGDDHARALGGEDPRGRAADAGAAAGDENDFVAQQGHACSPPESVVTPARIL